MEMRLQVLIGLIERGLRDGCWMEEDERIRTLYNKKREQSSGGRYTFFERVCWLGRLLFFAALQSLPLSAGISSFRRNQRKATSLCGRGPHAKSIPQLENAAAIEE